jgi:hypothetical protein
VRNYHFKNNQLVSTFLSVTTFFITLQFCFFNKVALIRYVGLKRLVLLKNKVLQVFPALLLQFAHLSCCKFKFLWVVGNGTAISMHLFNWLNTQFYPARA